MKDFSVVMALVDFIPVVLFAIASVLFQRDLYGKMSKGAFALFAAGTVNVIFAGTLKATYKLLYAAGVCDFQILSDMMLPLEAIGFTLAGIGMLALLCHKQTKGGKPMLAVAPVLFSGKAIFIVFMVIGLACMNIGFCVMSVRMKKYAAVALFTVSFICSLSMGYLSSRDFTQAGMNWIAEGINIAGQGTMLAGAIMLHRAGLASADTAR